MRKSFLRPPLSSLAFAQKKEAVGKQSMRRTWLRGREKRLQALLHLMRKTNEAPLRGRENVPQRYLVIRPTLFFLIDRSVDANGFAVASGAISILSVAG